MSKHEVLCIYLQCGPDKGSWQQGHFKCSVGRKENLFCNQWLQYPRLPPFPHPAAGEVSLIPPPFPCIAFAIHLSMPQMAFVMWSFVRSKQLLLTTLRPKQEVPKQSLKHIQCFWGIQCWFLQHLAFFPSLKLPWCENEEFNLVPTGFMVILWPLGE